MSNIKIRNLDGAENEQIISGNYIPIALNSDQGQPQLTKKATFGQVVSGGITGYSGDASYIKFTNGLSGDINSSLVTASEINSDFINSNAITTNSITTSGIACNGNILVDGKVIANDYIGYTSDSSLNLFFAADGNRVSIGTDMFLSFETRSSLSSPTAAEGPLIYCTPNRGGLMFDHHKDASDPGHETTFEFLGHTFIGKMPEDDGPATLALQHRIAGNSVERWYFQSYRDTTNDTSLLHIHNPVNHLTDLRILFGDPNGSPTEVDLVGDFTASSNIHAGGTVTASAGKPFKIPHPLVEGKDLMHIAVESPRADLIYRGKIKMNKGKASVEMNSFIGTSKGTIQSLIKDDVQIFLQNNSGWDSVKGSFKGSTLSIVSNNESCEDEIDWMIISERKDDSYINSYLTDEQGNFILEPDSKS